MQHFRVPTRLLDWTYSPYVALYFALEGENRGKRNAVWAISVTALHSRATLKMLPVEELPDGTEVRPPIRLLDFSERENFQRYVLPDLDTYHRTHLFGEPALFIVVPLIPRAQNERLSAQQGLFLCPSMLGASFIAQAEELMQGADQEWIVKVEIEEAAREEARRRLFTMNIHPLSLFPGPDGLGQFCAQKAELWGWE